MNIYELQKKLQELIDVFGLDKNTPVCYYINDDETVEILGVKVSYKEFMNKNLNLDYSEIIELS